MTLQACIHNAVLLVHFFSTSLKILKLTVQISIGSVLIILMAQF